VKVHLYDDDEKREKAMKKRSQDKLSSLFTALWSSVPMERGQNRF
jgi:hypothetical protein